MKTICDERLFTYNLLILEYIADYTNIYEDFPFNLH